MPRSGQHIALLQGIAKTAPALSSLSAVLMHQDVTGPAPPYHITEGSPTDQAQSAASILQHLPLRSDEGREGVLAGR